MRITGLILFQFMCFISALNAQNLVPNGSFENHKTCPPGINAGFACVYPDSWKSASEGTPDYFNRCCKNKNYPGVPENFAGRQEPRTGDAYMGIIVYSYFDPETGHDYREYIQVQLNDSLKKGELYFVRFYVSLANRTNFESPCIGAVLSKEAIGPKLGRDEMHRLHSPPMPYKPQIQNDSTRFISYDTNWVEISGVYKAGGGEKYLTIGDFYSTKQNIIRKRKDVTRTNDEPGWRLSYYYIDDVSMFPESEKDNIENWELKAGSKMNLKNVLFQTGKTTLLPTSNIELNKLLDLMKKNPELAININGHTDNVGDENSNLSLSEGRAKAVFDYLISKGINKKRLTYKGYGSSKPIADNNSDEGKQLNRRVEIEIANIK